MGNKCIMELTADTAILISEISKLPRGSEIYYASHFSNWLGRPIKRSEDISTMDTVYRRLRKDHDIVLSPIHGKGYKLLTHAEAVADKTQVEKARRAAKRRKEELATVQLAELNEIEKLHWAASVTQSHLIIETAKDKTTQRLESACNGAAEPLALAKAFDAIKANL